MNLPKDKQSYVLWLNQIKDDHISIVGDKAARLARLSQMGFSIPDGFVVDSKAFQDTLLKSDSLSKIQGIIDQINLHDVQEIQQASMDIQKIISRIRIPKHISMPIFESYHQMGGQTIVALRASSQNVSESLYHQKPVLGIKGDASVLDFIRKIWAGFFTQHQVTLIKEGLLDLSNLNISVVVEKMIDSDTSGITFTSSPDGQHKNRTFVYAVWGIRNEYVQNGPFPDLYSVDNQNNQITSKEIIEQRIMLKHQNEEVVQVEVGLEKQSIQKVTDSNILEIAKIGKSIEDRLFYPQKVEWSIKDGKLFILDSTLLNPNQKIVRPKKSNQESMFANLKLIGNGQKIHSGVVSGPVRWIKSEGDVRKVSLGEIVITKSEYLASLPFAKLAGIVVVAGSMQEKNLIFLKEYGIPSMLLHSFSITPKNGAVISLHALSGSLYQGAIPAKKIKITSQEESLGESRIKTATKLYVNINTTESIKNLEKNKVEGVGIFRSEMMLLEIMQEEGKQITNKLISSINLACQKMDDKPVFFRFSDQPVDDSLLGLRGVRRHIQSASEFSVEAKAFHRAKYNYQHQNLHLLLPFVRSSSDVKEIKRVLAEHQINRSKDLQFWIMAETPGSILDLPEIIKLGIDGVVVGLNDLTMLTLGVDRRQADLMNLYGKNQSSVRTLVKKALAVGKIHDIPIILSGGSVEIHPDLIEEAIAYGVHGFSVEMEELHTVRNYMHLAEKRLIGIQI